MEERLIELYCTICQCNDSRFIEGKQRLSNNNCPQFSDEELITVYLWRKAQQFITRKTIYNYTKSHLSTWFPALPSYQAFCRLFADQAYCDVDWAESLEKCRDIEIITPKKRKRYDVLRSGNCSRFSVSSARQPIESFFHWANLKSAFQDTSRTLSLGHLFPRFRRSRFLRFWGSFLLLICIFYAFLTTLH